MREVTGRIAVIGNPNCGKSSIFNHLTGLRQRTGNFPGVTVEKLSGLLRLADGRDIQLTDFPGTYSLYPTSFDEYVVFDVLSNAHNPYYPDLILFVADAIRLEQHLLLLSQVRDMGIPALLAINLVDAASKAGMSYDTDKLQRALNVPVIPVNGRTGAGMDDLQYQILQFFNHPEPVQAQPVTFTYQPIMAQTVREIKSLLPELKLDFQALIVAHHAKRLSFLHPEQVVQITNSCAKAGFNSLQAQYAEIMDRYQVIDQIIRSCKSQSDSNTKASLTRRLDKVVTHVLFGPILFFIFLFFVFQAVFTWSTLPMEWIEALFNHMGGAVRYALGQGWLASLLADGVLAGLGGVLVFIPQIALLFFLIALLEESGYMARAVFLFDRMMQKFGLNGRSLVALVSSTACAIPAIMSARTITNRKERLITILVTPFISCSARLPVYAVLVGMMVPSGFWAGFISYQALAFMGLYILGAGAAFIAALIFKKVLAGAEPGYLLIELPDYQMPHWRNVIQTVWSKVTSFIREAGQIIIIISIVLWFLASFGPPGKMETARASAKIEASELQLDQTATANKIASHQLEASWAGHLGKGLEPLIRPLGFDWKIGIALVTSFAAREVFVGTMATIYSIGGTDNEQSIRKRMMEEVNPDTGKKRYNLAVSLSLLLFYVFAMQCMSTLAVVKKETGSWKWPLIQLVFMTGLAYLASLIAFQSMTYLGMV
ncbi:MAG: ferrous iron transport protein B [Saprospiraceae bacterium]|nr:ferrous iron transport protein B [Saprospiraceae bacterium]